ncbi:MAG: hypothetical protein SGCHY_002798, partial [Lobulomycetales sp.]
MQLSEETFRRVAPSAYTNLFTRQGTRTSGRAFDQSRPAKVQSSVFAATSAGSAQTRIGNT